MEIVSSIAEKLANYVFNALGRQIGYLFHYNDNIESLRKQAGKLTDLQETVQEKIDAARRNNGQIEAPVQKWLDKVKIISGDANKFLEDDVKAEKRCLNGWCSNLSSRYQLGKEAQKKTEAISKLQQEGSFESVSLPAPPPGIISASTSISGALSSRQLLETKVMKGLKDDNVSMIGICGMGGVGKTTLVKKIGKQAEEVKLFDKVVMAVVSQNPNVTNIQTEIANMLGLKSDNNDESARAGLLWERIKNEKRILVILDDVWDELKLDKVGIPYGEDHKGCKIVLTSRSKHVCDDMNAKEIFTVEVLLDKESWDLFREAAGEVVDSSDINPIAREVVAKCGGLPIAILTVGKALKNKKSQSEWNAAANQLKKSVTTNIRGVEKKVILPLKLSYDYLESEGAKSCFLLCCLFPEDFDIPVEALVRYGWGLRLFKDAATVEEARGVAQILVGTLITSHLLLEGRHSKYVRMHDVVREVAISIASKDKINLMAKAGIELKDWPNDENFENFTGISLMSNDIHELPDGHECPKLQTLLLQSNSPLKIHDMFFQGMKELKVLDMSDIRPLSLPPSLSVLANLRTLQLEDCRLDDISEIGKLSNLEILSFSESDIKEIPKHFGQLSRLRLFDLSYCRELTLISPGVISSLRRLEELSMKQSFLDWDVDGGDSRSNASLFELQALPGLTSLHIGIPNASSLPTDMPFQHLTTFTISIGNTRDFSYGYHTYSRGLFLTHDTTIPLLGWVKNLIKRTEHLALTDFIGLRNIIPDLDNNGFNELKSLLIFRCEKMNCLLNTLEWAPQKAFHTLERLSLILCEKLKTVFPPSLLQSLINLKEIEITGCSNLEEIIGKQEKEEEGKEIVVCNKDPTSVSPTFPNLTSVTLWDCNKMRNLFSPSIVRGLAQLRELSVGFCGMMQEIVSDEEREEGASMETIVFPRLKLIWLKGLDSLTSFCPGRRYTFEWPALKELRIEACPKMETFGYGDQVTPKLEKVFGDEWLWMCDLNATVRVQHLFKNPVMT